MSNVKISIPQVLVSKMTLPHINKPHGQAIIDYMNAIKRYSLQMSDGFKYFMISYGDEEDEHGIARLPEKIIHDLLEGLKDKEAFSFYASAKGRHIHVIQTDEDHDGIVYPFAVFKALMG